MENYIVETRNLKKYYQQGTNTVKALDGVDFRVKAEEFVAIIGKSGSGKSTLLHMIGGLDVPTSGSVIVGGKNLAGLTKEQLAIFRRRKIGFVFQSYNLVQDLNVYENIILPVELDGKRVDHEFVQEIMELLQLEERREALPSTLSGGQQQRVAIARALVSKPTLILADEPTGNLDTATGHDVLGLLKIVAKQFRQTIVLITHDNDIAQMADRMVLAIMLSSFLLFSVFTVGATYLKMQRQQNIRLNGAEFDAIMYGISEEQKEILEENPTVEHYGVVMVSGVVAETEADKTPGVGLLYADDTYWKKMMAPARKFVKGHYPVEENEVMVTEDALKKCGFSDKKIGDEITFVYEINEKREAKTFRISGIWDGYGDTDNFYMSKAFCDKQKLDAVYYGRCHISFCKKWMSDEAQQAFIDSMKLKKSQRLFYVYEYGNATEIFLGLSGIALVTVLSAYLLIYNIMYLSVAGNIRYYGLLQTIGMTGRQIRQLMQKQLLWIGGIGMLAGILIGAGTSFFLIPVVVKTFVSGKEMGAVQVTFHPCC